MRFLLLLIGVVMIMSGCSSKGVRVGMLCDEEATDPKSREAAWQVLSTARGLDARRITGADIRAGVLNELDVVMFPGGTGGGEGRAMGVEGAEAVTRFVEQGGGVVAVCAGGYLVVEGWTPETRAIELLNAETWDDDHWERGMGFIQVEVLAGESGAEADQRTMWFENGPIFAPLGRDTMPVYTPLVRYVTDMAAPGAPTGMMTGRDAVVAAPFGQGRVVAFGPHPELSPGLEPWLASAVRWAAEGPLTSPPSVSEVLERAE